MNAFKSLGARFTAAIFVTAVVTFAVFVALIVFQLNRGLSSQADQLAKLSEQKLAERLDAEAKLAQARVRNLFEDAARRLAAIATRGDTVQALASSNVVAISELVGPAAEAAEIDAIVAVDTKMRVIGAHHGDLDLLAINRALQNSDLVRSLGPILADNDPRRPRGYNSIVLLDQPIFAATNVDVSTRLGEIIAYPFFDDFGDVTGVLIGLRALKSHEPALVEFTALTGAGVLVTVEGDTVISIGANGARMSDNVRDDTPLRRTTGGAHWARCVDYVGLAQVCAVAPISELSVMRDELMRIGLSEARTLLAALLVIALLALALFALTARLVARQVTRPLAQITKAVSAVAQGDCTTRVEGTERADEVGDIARAVLVLQSSMEERDRLRQDVVRQNDTLRQREDELRQQNLWFDAALNNMSQGLCMFDAQERLIVSNLQYQRLYDLPFDTLNPGTPLRTIVARSKLLASPAKPSSGPEAPGEGTASLVQNLPDGRVIAISRRPMRDGGWVATSEDITERQRTEARIAHLASHDSLTDLPNRTLFRERLENCFSQQERYGGEFALLCLDLDEFKTVNDTLGHPVGDRLLRMVSGRLRDCIRGGDILSRLGGDEFAVIQMGVTNPASSAELAQRLIDVIQEPYDLDGHQAIIGVSIGIGFAPRDGADPDTILKNADLALYRAKAGGRNTFRYFEVEMDEALRQRRALEMDLRHALANGELFPFFQPLVNLRDDRVVGFEALMRWRHPERGMVPPGIFIPIAEEIGLIATIGEWMLREACMEARNWPSHCKVAVNISAVQIKHRNLTQVVMNALAASGLPAARLELEITESVLLEEDDYVLATLRQLKGLGIRFSMDDFGTGYSSLSCLRSFPFDKIKIDQSFVRDMIERADCAAIVRTINDLAQTLGMITTAEGVETAAQLERLRLEGCDEVQGYFLGRPMSAADARALMGVETPSPASRNDASLSGHPKAAKRQSVSKRARRVPATAPESAAGETAEAVKAPAKRRKAR